MPNYHIFDFNFAIALTNTIIFLIALLIPVYNLEFYTNLYIDSYTS
jgi:hypothetical protein